MCRKCWEEYGAPKIWSKKIQAAADSIAEVYRHSAVGGNLHIVIDDFNIEDDNLKFCHDEMHNAEARNSTDRHDLMMEEECYNCLIVLSVEERAAALALHDGYFTADECTEAG